MIALVLAAVVSLESRLPAFSEFLTNAEINIKLPLTSEMVTKKIVDPEGATIRVQSRYYLSFWARRVREFADMDEDPGRMLTRLDPAEMKKWSEQPCLITETNALEIAKRLFQRLGFKPEDFGEPEVNRYRWQPSESNPNHVLLLPAFHIRWIKKGFVPWENSGLAPEIEMAISGTTKKLIRYSATFDLRQWSQSSAKEK